MKIICNKIEFAQIVRNCYKADGRCDLCLLSGICNGNDYIAAIADVDEEREHPERRMCSTCKFFFPYESEKGPSYLCKSHSGLAQVTPYTMCSYWGPAEIAEAGDPDE